MKKHPLFSLPKLIAAIPIFVLICLMILFRFAASAETVVPGGNIRDTVSDIYEQTSTIRIDRAEQIRHSPILANFRAWVDGLQSVSFEANKEEIARGLDLAIKRRELIKELIQIDPESAIRESFSASDLKGLPTSIVRNMERHINARGDFWVSVNDSFGSYGSPDSIGTTERYVLLGKSKYKAFVYGRRMSMTTKLDIPLRGIVLDDLLALDEGFVEIIVQSESEPREIRRSKLWSDGIDAKVGGVELFFRDEVELKDFIEKEIAWETTIGPERAKSERDRATSSWTIGVKKILIIRVDFSDRPGDPVDTSGYAFTQQRVQDTMDNEVNPFFSYSSYNRTSLQTTVTTLVRMPNPQNYYTPATIMSVIPDARVAARAAGFETDNFDLDVVVFAVRPDLGTSGKAYLGAKGAIFNGGLVKSVARHELGHNYGLNHASLLASQDLNPIGQGFECDGCDPFDQMGSINSYNREYYNAGFKRILDWIGPDSIASITNSGTYRVFDQDAATPTGILLLRIQKDSSRFYEISYKEMNPFFDAFFPGRLNGAAVRFFYPAASKTQLLDMTPETIAATPATLFTTGLYDSCLPIGRTFVDNENSLSISVLGRGNTTPQSLDIQVNFSDPTPIPFFSVSGKVMSTSGIGLRNTTVSLTDSLGIRRSTTTSSFGVYSFSNVLAGSGYAISVQSKRYRFASQVMSVNTNLTNVDFLGLE